MTYTNSAHWHCVYREHAHSVVDPENRTGESCMGSNVREAHQTTLTFILIMTWACTGHPTKTEMECFFTIAIASYNSFRGGGTSDDIYLLFVKALTLVLEHLSYTCIGFNLKRSFSVTEWNSESEYCERLKRIF